jgi:hypothetical protein
METAASAGTENVAKKRRRKSKNKNAAGGLPADVKKYERGQAVRAKSIDDKKLRGNTKRQEIVNEQEARRAAKNGTPKNGLVHHKGTACPSGATQCSYRRLRLRCFLWQKSSNHTMQATSKPMGWSRLSSSARTNVRPSTGPLPLINNRSCPVFMS